MSTVTITAAEVNQLRQKTGAGMMDCKKALIEANGDMEAAIDFLRKKGQKVAANRSDREASEGQIIAKLAADGKSGFIITVNCETDFVAKNESFGKLAESFLDIAISNNIDSVDALKAASYDGKISVTEKITEQIGVIGEKVDISGLAKLSADQVVAYIHPGNRLATLVALNKSGEAVADAGKQVAMQVAAMSPVAVDKDDVDQETINREIEIGKEQAIQEGKPAEMAEKIAQGKLNKFFKESTLLNQEFIRDNKLTVSQFLQTVDKELTVTAFKRFSLD
jgi:elongation factor Ts